MYRVEVDGTIVHESNSNDHEYLAVSAGLTLEFNRSGTLTITVPPTNYAYKTGKMKKLVAVVKVYRDSRLVWKGRILDSSKDFLGRMTYKCEGWMSVLCDSVVRPEGDKDKGITANPLTYFTQLISKHNSQVGILKSLTAHVSNFNPDTSTHSRLEIGATGAEVRLLQTYLNKIKTYNYTVTVDGEFGVATQAAVIMFQSNNGLTADGVVGNETWAALEAAVNGTTPMIPASVTFPVGNYETTLDYIQANFLNNEEVGGRLYVVDSDIYYCADGTEPFSSQEIIFGENLLDLTEYIDASEVYTVLIPTGKDDLKLSPDYVENQNAIQLFGRIVRHEDFTDIDNAATLRTKAIEVLNKNIDASTTIEISAFDLSLLNADVDSIELGTYTRILSPAHGIDKYYLCIGATLDLCNPALSLYSFGVNPDTLTMRQNRLSNAVRRTAGNYASSQTTTNIGYEIEDGRVTVNSISFKRSNRMVSLSFNVKFLQVVQNSDPVILTFASDYAPTSQQNGIAVDETTETNYTLRVTTGGAIQVINNGQIAVNDIVTGSLSWQK